MIALLSVPDMNLLRTQTLPNTETPLVLPTLSPDGRWLAAGDPTGSLRLIELETDAVGRDLTLSPTNNTGVLSLAFSKDSRTLAAAFRDSTAIVLLEVGTGEVVHRLHGHPGFVQNLLFSSAGDRLVSADGDRLIKVWDPRDGRELATFTGHRAGINSLDLTSDGRTLASAAGDGSVRLWHLNTGRELLRFDPPETAGNVTFAPDGSALFIQSALQRERSFPTLVWRAPSMDAIAEQGTSD
jgi:WD40 repeat protein